MEPNVQNLKTCEEQEDREPFDLASLDGRDIVREAREACWARDPQSYVLGNITAEELDCVLTLLEVLHN